MTNFTAQTAKYRPPCHTEGGLLVHGPGHPESPWTCTICWKHWALNDQGEPVPYTEVAP